VRESLMFIMTSRCCRGLCGHSQTCLDAASLMFRIHLGTCPQATVIDHSNKSTRANPSIGWSVLYETHQRAATAVLNCDWPVHRSAATHTSRRHCLIWYLVSSATQFPTGNVAVGLVPGSALCPTKHHDAS
jgi:hypothetical protein